MDPQIRTVDQILAEIASGAHGVATRAELRAAGLSVEQIRRRVRSGALIRMHRGVYRVGHTAPSREATYLAAVKACGPGALLERRAAAHLHRLIRGSPPAPEVITPGDHKLAEGSVRRCRNKPEDGCITQGIPCTTIPRTIVDLAGFLDSSELARLVHEASVIHGIEPKQVERILARRRNWPGAGELRKVLWGETSVTLSRLESRFLSRLREAGLPAPHTNQKVDGRYVDCRWPEHRLTVELDGYRYHRTRHAWERDREREREARVRGDEFRRYTWEDVAEPGFMLRDLALLLL
jgi:hypothetical protein